jgi:hypothetical protein
MMNTAGIMTGIQPPYGFNPNGRATLNQAMNGQSETLPSNVPQNSGLPYPPAHYYQASLLFSAGGLKSLSSALKDKLLQPFAEFLSKARKEGINPEKFEAQLKEAFEQSRAKADAKQRLLVGVLLEVLTDLFEEGISEEGESRKNFATTVTTTHEVGQILQRSKALKGIISSSPVLQSNLKTLVPNPNQVTGTVRSTITELPVIGESLKPLVAAASGGTDQARIKRAYDELEEGMELPKEAQEQYVWALQMLMGLARQIHNKEQQEDLHNTAREIAELVEKRGVQLPAKLKQEIENSIPQEITEGADIGVRARVKQTEAAVNQAISLREDS